MSGVLSAYRKVLLRSCSRLAGNCLNVVVCDTFFVDLLDGLESHLTTRESNHSLSAIGSPSHSQHPKHAV